MVNVLKKRFEIPNRAGKSWKGPIRTRARVYLSPLETVHVSTSFFSGNKQTFALRARVGCGGVGVGVEGGQGSTGALSV